jgi:predicted permease
MRPSEIRPGIRRLFRLAVRRRDGVADEMDDEIRLHLQLRVQQLVAEGMSADAARAEAERRFGAIDEARATLHGSAARKEERLRVTEWAAGVAQGLRVTLRGLRRAPGFVVTVVTCVALGVGANAAAYSMFEELLLRPLPVHAPGELVNLGAPGPKPGGDQCNWSGDCEQVFSLPMVRDLMRARTGFSGIAAHRLFIANIAYGHEAASGDGVFVSGSYFPVLGLQPAAGRLLSPADDRTVGAHPVAVVSHAYWTGQLGADPAAVGRQVVINGRSLTIVGVAPEGFEGTTIGIRPRVYVPMAMNADVDPFFGPRTELENRRRYWVYAFARRAPGVTVERARREANAAYRAILADVEAPLQEGMSAQTLARFKAKEVTVEDGRHGQSILRGATRTPLVLLLAITGLVVLIACANIANLLLARGATRGTEVAVRLSLGAGRRQLVAQLLTESCLLAVVGGAASLLVARATLGLIASFIPPSLPGMGTTLALELRPSVLAFAAATALGTGLLFGLFPALHATRPDLIASIRSGAGQIAGGQRAAVRFRTSLVTAQIALSMALLGSAGLLIKSLRNVGRVDLGLDVDHTLAFALLPDLNGYERPRSRALFERVEDEVLALPGADGIAGSSVPLLTGSSSGTNVRVEGFVRGPDTDANTRVNAVGPGFFHVFGIPLLAGRDFTRADRLGAPQVAIVNEAFARKFGLGRNPVGKRLGVGDDLAGPLDVEIVGVARDAGYSDVKGGAPPLLFTPYRQDSTIGALAFYVRAKGAPERVLRGVPGAVARVDRTLPVLMLKTMAQQARENVYLDRMLGTLAAGFAGLATLLAAVGLYGVLSYTVAQRTREIGVRMALGASERTVRGLVLRQVGRMVLAGGVVGVVAALALGRAARSLLFGLQGHDPTAVAAAAAVLGAVALAAGWVPAWRAARVNPTAALRGD